MPITPDQVDAVNDLLNVLEKARGYVPLKDIHDACWTSLLEINEAVAASSGALSLQAAAPKPEPLKVKGPSVSPMESPR